MTSTATNFLNNNNNPDALSGDNHGTHVAGIAAAEIDNGIGVAGTAGGATIMPLKWYDGGTWTAAIIAETFTYAADNGAHIVNTSYNMDGWANDAVVHAAFDYMYDAGIIHFNSAGNGGALNPPRQVFEKTLLVASVDITDTKASSSNYGTGIDLASPGASVLSTTPNNTYSVFSGTSMAAPNAAGVAALIWSGQSHLDPRTSGGPAVRDNRQHRRAECRLCGIARTRTSQLGTRGDGKHCQRQPSSR